MIDQVRYFLGVLTVVAIPPGLLFWLVIHPWARGWRRLGPARTYLVVLPPVTTLGAVLFRARGGLLGADLGRNPILISIALALYAATIWLELQYWRHLSISTLMGLPELSRAGQGKGKLLNEGVYGNVRHPRYLSAGIGILANALIANYVGVYILILLLAPAGFLMLKFEERELVDRFGEDYRRYQREVPQILPRLRKPKRE